MAQQDLHVHKSQPRKTKHFPSYRYKWDIFPRSFASCETSVRLFLNPLINVNWGSQKKFDGKWFATDSCCFSTDFSANAERFIGDMKTKFIIISYLRKNTFTVRQNDNDNDGFYSAHIDVNIFHFYTSNKTVFHLQRRSHGTLRCEVSVHHYTCELISYNNQGEATTRPESSRTHQSFCWQHLETFRLRTQPQLLQIWWRPL